MTINIIEKELTVNEMVVLNEDDSYSIFLNKNLCDEKKCDAFLHAMKHIWLGDFDKDRRVHEVESRAHA